MAFLLALTIFSVTMFIQIIIPASNIVALFAFHRLNNLHDFTNNALYIFCATFIMDTVKSIPLGSYAFGWLLLIGPVFLIKFIGLQIYHPKIAVIETLASSLYISLAALSHAYLVSLLSNVPIIPELNQVIITCISALILVLLTKHPSTRQ